MQGGGARLLKEFLDHARSGHSAREALQTFIARKGDVLLAYENEAISAKEAGEELDYVSDETILIENPVAVARPRHRREAQAFIDFLFAEEAQQIFGGNGYRPVKELLARRAVLPEPAAFHDRRLGRRGRVRAEFFDREDGIGCRIEGELGVGTYG